MSYKVRITKYEENGVYYVAVDFEDPEVTNQSQLGETLDVLCMNHLKVVQFARDEDGMNHVLLTDPEPDD